MPSSAAGMLVGRLRPQEGIPPDDVNDCCVSMWPCLVPCAVTQMFRQEGLSKHNYEPFATHGGEASIKLMAVVPV